MRRLLLILATLSALPLSYAQSPRTFISGVVIRRDTLTPLTSATVLLRRIDSAERYQQELPVDENGQFSLEIANGEYAVSATAEGYVPSSYESGTMVRVDARASGRYIRAIPVIEAGRIEGRILDKNGIPATGATVRALLVSYTAGRKSISSAATAVADDRGVYSLSGLTPGEYYVAAEYRTTQAVGTDLPRPLSRRREELPLVRTYFPGGYELQSAMRVPVAEGSTVSRLDFQVVDDALASVSGLVEGGGVSAQLFLVLNDPGTADVPLQSLAVQGAFQLAGVAPGSYTLFARSTGGAFGQTPVVVNGDLDVSGLTIAMRPGITLRGTVVGIGGLLDRPLTVRLLPADNRPGGSMGPSRNFIPVAADGTFSILNVPPGNYFIEVTGLPTDWFLRELRQGRTDITATGTVSVRDNGTDPVELGIQAGGARVRGVLQDATGQSVPFGKVAIMPDPPHRNSPGFYRFGVSDEQGRFTVDGVAPGGYAMVGLREMPAGAWQSAEFLAQLSPVARVTLGQGQVMEDLVLRVGQTP